MNKLNSDANGFLIGEIINLPNAKNINNHLTSIKKDIANIANNINYIAQKIRSKTYENTNNYKKTKNNYQLPAVNIIGNNKLPQTAANNILKTKNKNYQKTVQVNNIKALENSLLVKHLNQKTAKTPAQLHQSTYQKLNNNHAEYEKNQLLAQNKAVNNSLNLAHNNKPQLKKPKQQSKPFYLEQQLPKLPKLSAKNVALPKQKTNNTLQKHLQSAQILSNSSSIKNTPKRDNKGRFIGKNKDGQPTQGNDTKHQDHNVNNNNKFNLSSETISKVGQVVNQGLQNIGQNDSAFKAIGEILNPFKKVFNFSLPAFKFLFKRNKNQDVSEHATKQTNFLRKILAKIDILNQTQNKFNKPAQKSLKGIEHKKTPKNTRGLFGISAMLGLLLRPILGIVAGGGFLASIFTGIGKFATTLIRKIPLLAGLFTLGKNLFSIFKAETSDKTRAEKNITLGKASGRIAGSLSGMALGAKIGASLGSVIPVVGTAIGTVVGAGLGFFGGDKLGDIIGEKCANFFNQVDFKELWNKALNAWFGAIELFKIATQKIANAINTVKNLPKIAQDKTAKLINTGKKELSIFKFNVQDLIGKGLDKTTNTLKDIKNTGKNALGAISAQFESGKNSFSAISSGAGDFGGASYGKYQLSSTTGTLAKFLHTKGYAKDFAGLVPASHSFNQKWRTLAKNNPDFNRAQDEFIRDTHFKPALNQLKKHGINLENKNKAVLEAVFSTSTQFGASGGANLIKNALQDSNVDNLSDVDIINRIQNYKINNNHKLFKNSSLKVQNATLKRAIAEKEQLLQLIQTAKQAPKLDTTKEITKEITKETETAKQVKALTYAKSAQVQNAPLASNNNNFSHIKPVSNQGLNTTFMQNLPSVTSLTPNINLANTIKPAEPLVMPLNSKQIKPIVKVIMPADKLGQDIADRSLAHVINGGLSY